MPIKNCPNCGGELQKKNNKWKCPYCNSSYDLEESKKKNDELFDSGMFYVDIDKEEIMKKKNTVDSIKMWKYCLDEMDSADKIEDYLKKVTQKDDGTAMAEVRNERIEALLGRIEPELESGERIIILVDTSLFGKGKEFYIITDRACRFFKKKEVISVEFDDIVSIKVDDSFNLPSFYINDNYQNSVSSVANSYQTVGVMLALISRLTFERNKDRMRIRITK